MVKIALVGDYDSRIPAHAAIPEALRLAGREANVDVEGAWLATDAVAGSARAKLASFDGVWCVPGSPYRSMDGALEAIAYARTAPRPFLGTCGGFQHALIEYARAVAGLRDADHAESNPTGHELVIAPLACSLVGARGRVVFTEGSRIAAAVGRNASLEAYHCRFGVNRDYVAALGRAGLAFTGFDGTDDNDDNDDDAGDVRALEIAAHPFFVATLFQPERAALEHEAHPLITAFVRACAAPRA